MTDENYFLHPAHDWQRRYEALRASCVDRLPAKASPTASAIDHLMSIFITPFIERLDLPTLVRKVGLPGTKMISALNYLLSFLALKLIGTEWFSHMSDHSFDTGLGLFAGLNVLPKCTAMSTYAYSLDALHLQKLPKVFVRAKGLKIILQA